MKYAARQILTLALVAVYGGISVLGYGLHSLLPEHGHHDGLKVVHIHDGESGHFHCGHHDYYDCAAPEADDHESPLVAASDGCADSHVCEICVFLIQSCSERTQVAASVVSQHVVAAASAPLQRSYSPISLDSHSPRGPPQLVA